VGKKSGGGGGGGAEAVFERAVLLKAAGTFRQIECKCSIRHVQPIVLFPFRKTATACKSTLSRNA